MKKQNHSLYKRLYLIAKTYILYMVLIYCRPLIFKQLMCIYFLAGCKNDDFCGDCVWCLLVTISSLLSVGIICSRYNVVRKRTTNISGDLLDSNEQLYVQPYYILLDEWKVFFWIHYDSRDTNFRWQYLIVFYNSLEKNH